MEEIDLKQLLNMFWTRKAQILLIILLFVVIGIFFTIFIMKPKYQATTSLVLTKTESGSSTDGNAITQTDVTLNQKLVSTYSEVIKTQSVLRQVLDNLEINDITEEELRKNITVTARKNTEVIDIRVRLDNDEYVDIIAEEIATVFEGKVQELFDINNVTVVEHAKKPVEPYNINHVRDILIFIAIGMVVSIAYVVIANMLDTTIKNSEDVEKDTELVVLATIPKYDFESTTDKGGNK